MLSILRNVGLTSLTLLANVIHVVLVVSGKDEDGNLPYSPLLVVFLCELIKLVASVGILLVKRPSLEVEPILVLKWILPALIFCIDNNLSLVVIVLLHAATYQLLMNFKIVAVSIFMRVILKRKLTVNQKFSLAILLCGLITSQYTCDNDYISNNAVGYLGVLLMCSLASVADVYCEALFKAKDKGGQTTSIHIQNAILYLWGVLLNASGLWLQHRHFAAQTVSETGLRHTVFDGFGWLALAVSVNMAVNGLAISGILKFLDNFYKTFAGTAVLVIVTIISALWFERPVTFPFGLGTFQVITATFLYYLNKPLPPPLAPPTAVTAGGGGEKPSTFHSHSPMLLSPLPQPPSPSPSTSPSPPALGQSGGARLELTGLQRLRQKLHPHSSRPGKGEYAVLRGGPEDDVVEMREQHSESSDSSSATALPTPPTGTQLSLADESPHRLFTTLDKLEE